MAETDPLERITWRGWDGVDRKTAAALSVAERRLGYEMDIVQGPYNASVGASAGTHDGGGVVDLSPFDHERKVKVLRDLGFAAWYRPAVPKLWGAHVHAVMEGHQDLAPAAKRQVQAFDMRRDGLAGNAMDPNKYHPNVEPFNYAAWLGDAARREKITGINAKRKRLLDKIAAAKAKRERLKIQADKARDRIRYR
jgi:hypothetical protein